MGSCRFNRKGARMRISGISAISFAPHTEMLRFGLPRMQEAFETGITGVNDLSLTLQTINAGILEDFMGKVLNPKYHVRIKTKRTPRKMKKAKKKAGTYNSQRTINIPNAEIKATLPCI